MIALLSWLDGAVLALLGTWPDEVRTGWLIATTVAALVLGPLGGAVIGLGHVARPSPAKMRLRAAGQLGRVRRDLVYGLRSWRTVVWFLSWSLAGGMFGLAGFLFAVSENGIEAGLAAGLAVGVSIWCVIIVVRALETPLDATHTVSPIELLRADRDTSLRQGILVGAIGAALIWLFIGLAVKPAFGQEFGVIFRGGAWLVGWLAAAVCGLLVWLLFVSAWGPWLIARSWLASTGQLPWSTVTFLTDAHQRGVLRHVGGIYQFRHTRLRDHLAGETRGVNERSGPE